MKKIIMTFVSMITMVNVIGRIDVINARAEDVKEVNSVSEAVDWLKQVYTEGYVEKTAFYKLDEKYSIYFNYEYDVEEKRYEFTKCSLFENRFIGLYTTLYYYD